MPVQIITHTIKSAGGDYTSLTAWESAQQRDLTSGSAISGTITGTDGQIEKAECYNFDLSDSLNISGWTTTASNYLWVVSPTGERHDGRPRDTSASGFRIRTSANALLIREDYVRFQGLEALTTTTGGGSSSAVFLSSTGGVATSNDIRLEACILGKYGAVGAAVALSGATSAVVTMVNSMVYKLANSAGPAIDSRNIASAKFVNCTLYGFGTDSAGRGLQGATSTFVWNCYAGGFASRGFTSPTATFGGGGYNAADDTSATIYFGTTSMSNLVATAQFVSAATLLFPTSTAFFDFHLVATSGLIDAGSSTTTATLDIDGDSRS
jgi:hypothetical protein